METFFKQFKMSVKIDYEENKKKVMEEWQKV